MTAAAPTANPSSVEATAIANPFGISSVGGFGLFGGRRRPWVKCFRSATQARIWLGLFVLDMCLLLALGILFFLNDPRVMHLAAIVMVLSMRTTFKWSAWYFEPGGSFDIDDRADLRTGSTVDGVLIVGRIGWPLSLFIRFALIVGVLAPVYWLVTGIIWPAN